MPLRSLRYVLVVSLQFVLITAANAEEPTTPAQSEASSRFERGVELYADGALDAALAEFERAYQLTMDYRVLYNVGRVQMERHRYVEAIDALERYLGGSDIAESRREQVQADIAKLRARIGQLWVQSNVAGAELFVNGTSRGTLPLSGPIALNPGPCDVRVEKAGYTSTGQSLTIAGGDAPRVTLQMMPSAPVVSSPNSSSLPSTPKARYNYTPFWISAASAAALGGGAAVMGVLTLQKQNELEAELADPPSNADAVEAMRNEGKVMAAITDGLAIGAIVAGGIGVYYLIDPPKKKDHATGISAVRISAAPGRAMLSGRFW
jgi:tetratricopeptide (TPR) repeat protein